MTMFVNYLNLPTEFPTTALNYLLDSCGILEGTLLIASKGSLGAKEVVELFSVRKCRGRS